MTTRAKSQIARANGNNPVLWWDGYSAAIAGFTANDCPVYSDVGLMLSWSSGWAYARMVEGRAA